MSAPGDILRLAGVTKRFGGLVALDRVSLAFGRSAIAAVVGPNGAGKSTLFNVVSGVYRPDGGTVEFDGEQLPQGRPDRATVAGIARTFQNLRLFAYMSVLENVMVGEHARLRCGVADALVRTPRQRREERRARERALELLALVGLVERAGAYARDLPYGFARRLEIARALASEPKLLLLDEPAAGASAREKEALAALVVRLRESGTCIVIIEHDMTFVSALCERVVVLDAGVVIADGRPEQIRADSRVIDAYLGIDEG